MRDRIPWRVRAPVRRTRNAFASARGVVREAPRWRSIAATPPRRDGLAVSYGYEQMPGSGEVVYGGHVKFALLNEAMPNAPRDFNVLYLGSSALPSSASMLVRLARRRGAPFVWNQNGVAYRGWYGDGWELVNAPRAKLMHEAAYVFFQSAFCKLSAERFYGERQGPWEILHNPVDTRAFRPHPRGNRPLTLLLGGSQYQRYRIETALQTLAHVRRERPDALLLVSGALSFAVDGEREIRMSADRLGVGDAVELTGPYTQAEAPALFARADILLHTKYNDPCPTTVVEGLSAGLPIVYSASGGTPELVGEAGVGVEAPLDWESDHPPAPEALSDAVHVVAERLDDYATAARERAVANFDLEPWIARHRDVFQELVRA